jgi:hypothetical protein
VGVRYRLRASQASPSQFVDTVKSQMDLVINSVQVAALIVNTDGKCIFAFASETM